MKVAGNYPRPCDTGAQQHKGGRESDNNILNDPLLHIVHNLDSLALGFSIISIHRNCLESSKTQGSGSHTWVSKAVGLECGQEFAFLTSCHEVLILLVQGPHFDYHCLLLSVCLISVCPWNLINHHQVSIAKVESLVDSCLHLLAIFYWFMYFYIGSLILFLLLRMAFTVHSISF